MADRGAQVSFCRCPSVPVRSPVGRKAPSGNAGGFVSCVEALPADQALPAQAQAVAVLGAT